MSRFIKLLYYDEDMVASEGEPYCPRCWEVDGKRVHLIGPLNEGSEISFTCPECNRLYRRGNDGNRIVIVLR